MMNKENKKTKVKMKVNAFDIFVLLLVLCLIATLVYKIYTSIADESNTDNSKVMIEYVCEDEFNSILSYLHDGDAVYLESGEILGYIHKNSDTNELFEIITEEQTESETESDTFATATADNNGAAADYSKINFAGLISLNGNAIKSNKGSFYTIGEDNITVGGTIKVHTNRTEFVITVTSFGDIRDY